LSNSQVLIGVVNNYFSSKNYRLNYLDGEKYRLNFGGGDKC